jgi:hypothetical protein
MNEKELLYTVREYLGPLIFMAVFIGSMYLTARRTKARRQKMKQIALQLGLQYREQSDFLPSLNSASAGTGRGQQRVRQLQQGGTLGGILSFLVQPAISGKYGGWPVDIRTVNENKTVFTKFRLDFGRPLGLGLRIGANGFFQRDLFGGSPRIESGNEEFDKKVLVRGRDELKVKFLVKRPETQRALLDAYRAFSDIVIDDEGITCKMRGSVDTYQKYQAILNALATVATRIAPAQSDAQSDNAAY